MSKISQNPEIIILEWSYSPSGYFEERVVLSGESYELVLDDGKATAKMEASVFDGNQSIRDEIRDQLEARFIGAQIVTYKSYKLSSNPTIVRQHPDGRRNISISASAGVLTITRGLDLDIQIVGPDGEIISDTRQERITKTSYLAEFVARYRQKDITLAGMLRSFDAAIRDPPNELVHLSEIREAIKHRFGGEPAAQATLGISRNLWRRLGQLANDEPLNQGRHRGKHLGQLRDATPNELQEARNIAKRMIKAYLKYLEAKP